MSKGWSGSKSQKARELVATWLPAPCGQCGKQVTASDKWVVGHTVPRWEAPHLTWDVTNWRPEHDACSRTSAQREVIRKARQEGAAMERERMAQQGALGAPCSPAPHKSEGSAHLKLVHSSGPGFPHGATVGKSPLVPISPSIITGDHPTPRDGLLWQPEALKTYPWLAEFADVPEDASPPLWMSLPPEDAICSYASPTCTHLPEDMLPAIEWMETNLEERGRQIAVRWWQKLAITRQLEHREDGTLCHREIVESAPRRAGKSVRLRVVALWRMAVGNLLFGETQLVVHTGADMQICREIQMKAWRWAEDVAKWKVSRANGKEAIETKAGDRWLVRSQESTNGLDTCLGMVDEGWNVKADAVSENLEPSLLERFSPQLQMTSTAHRKATSLMPNRITTALTTDDPEVLLLVWAAPFDADPADPETWRTASPHWTEDRRKLIASMYAKALAGESDPELDDPDPMAGFASQYLNRWRLTGRRAKKGEAVIEPTGWSDLTEQSPAGPPTSAAIESWFSDGVSLALAWKVGTRAVVSVQNHPDLASAVAARKMSGHRGRVTVGASLTNDPALKGVPVTSGEGRTGASAQELRSLLREDGFRHDGTDHLTGQVLNVRTVDGADGPRMASTGRADAMKAAVWAAKDARSKRPTSFKILLPSSANDVRSS